MGCEIVDFHPISCHLLPLFRMRLRAGWGGGTGTPFLCLNMSHYVPFRAFSA